jgi:hypothetical protein
MYIEAFGVHILEESIPIEFRSVVHNIRVISVVTYVTAILCSNFLKNETIESWTRSRNMCD